MIQRWLSSERLNVCKCATCKSKIAELHVLLSGTYTIEEIQGGGTTETGACKEYGWKDESITMVISVVKHACPTAKARLT